MTIDGTRVDYSVDTANTLSTAGAKLWSWKNNAVEKAYVTWDGSYGGTTFVPIGSAPGISGCFLCHDHAKLAHPSLRLRDLHPLHRLRPIGSIPQMFPDRWPVLFQVFR